MKKIVKIISCVLLLLNMSCNKAIQDIQSQTVVNAITDGVWTVTKFTQAGTDITANFSGWEFKFLSNGTTIASKVSTTNVSGTWTSNAASITFTAYFPSNAPTPLEKLSSSWFVTSAVSSNKGTYARTESNINYELELTKK